MGRTASSGGDQGPPEEQLLTMPLQSPSGGGGGGGNGGTALQLTPFLQHHFPSPTGPGGGSGFTPPQTRPRVRSGEGVEGFPILSLAPSTNNEDDEEGTWQPPHPKISKGPTSSRS